MGALLEQTSFADDRRAAALRFPSARAIERIAPTQTVQEILAYAAEKEQALADLRGRIAELEHMVQTDELTGLLNRRGLESAAQRTLANAARYSEAGVLALIDLDGFKRVNDEHGHAAGDAALKVVARILREHARATDYAARLAGDEFAILWVRASPIAIEQRHRSLKAALDAAVLIWEGAEIAVKASVGTAAYNGTTLLDDLMQRADKSMYFQKNIRNRG
ncbi:MAG: GGDEF domain-containing protein [Alphaproteobacteria bacterium]|nr:GGDEF domain-containing protein [Alphaproteobacteria bacterium]